MRDALRRAQRATVGASVGSALVLATLVAGPTPDSAVAATPAAQPEAWADTCGTVDLAGQLSIDPDLDENDAPVLITPDARGKFVPVIMVHGWTGRSTHTDGRDGAFSAFIDLTSGRFGGPDVGRSLIGQIQSIPGAAVFTFDYHRYSGRWVDDPEVGGALGDAVDCLSAESGEEVILVGHSMGGLAARYVAAQPGRDGADRAADISTVVTFGTPQTGSILAAAIGNLLDSPALTLVRAILSYCGTVSTGAIESGSVCDALPAFARAFDGAAGRALRAGSSQLAALEPVPSTVNLHALAGESRVDVLNGGWFALPWETPRVPLGDFVVGAESAFSGAGQTTADACNYQLDAVRAGAEQIAIAFRLVAVDETSRLALLEGASPCFHTNLMRNIALTNEAVGVVSDDIRSREAPQSSASRSASYRLTGYGYDGYFFVSPSGNFECAIRDPSRRFESSAGCHGETSPVPVQPDRCPEGIGWGFGMQVLPLDRGDFPQVDYLCASELVYGHPSRQARLLPYGQSITAHGFTCTSDESGIRCEHDSSGHGFRIARNSNEIF